MTDQKKPKKQAAFGCLFWIAFILLLLVVFFLKKDTIRSVLNQTSFFEKLFNSTSVVDNSDPGEMTEAPVITRKTEEDGKNGTPVPITVVQGPPGQTEKPPAAVPVPQTSVPAATNTQGQPDPPPQTPPADKTGAQPPPADKKEPEKPVQKTRETRLFFIQIDNDGKVLRKEVSRTVPVSDSPLTDTLTILLRGPDDAEKKKGMMTLIPAGTSLISATVKNGVAELNLSDEFQFNQYGIEGYLGQMMQIVYTATSFPTVSGVQFLIEGQHKDYLGAEGVWVGSPLTRSSF